MIQYIHSQGMQNDETEEYMVDNDDKLPYKHRAVFSDMIEQDIKEKLRAHPIHYNGTASTPDRPRGETPATPQRIRST